MSFGIANAKLYGMSRSVPRSRVDGKTRISSAIGATVASIRAPRTTIPSGRSSITWAATRPLICSEPETDRFDCGGIRVCVVRRSFSRTYS